MRFSPFTLIVICCVSTNSHLVQKNTEKTTPEHTETTLRTRLTRDVSDEETVTGISKEIDSSNEAQPKPKEEKPYFRPKFNLKDFIRKVVRDTRALIESDDIPSVTDMPKPDKTKMLVKKPIPKYNELIDYDDDFQMKIMKSGMRLFQDSGEHEDQDFNVDDYEFDVNHDEFNTGRKHLEPRLKNKKELEMQALIDESTKKPAEPPLVKINSKVRIANKSKTINKRHNNYEKSKKAAFKAKDDYYDDFSTTSKGLLQDSSIKGHDLDDDLNDEITDSKEDEHKSLRPVRSPWMNNVFTNKGGEKTVGAQATFIGVLPMFPSSSLRRFK